MQERGACCTCPEAVSFFKRWGSCSQVSFNYISSPPTSFHSPGGNLFAVSVLRPPAAKRKHRWQISTIFIAVWSFSACRIFPNQKWSLWQERNILQFHGQLSFVEHILKSFIEGLPFYGKRKSVWLLLQQDGLILDSQGPTCMIPSCANQKVNNSEISLQIASIFWAIEVIQKAKDSSSEVAVDAAGLFSLTPPTTFPLLRHCSGIANDCIAQCSAQKVAREVMSHPGMMSYPAF